MLTPRDNIIPYRLTRGPLIKSDGAERRSLVKTADQGKVRPVRTEGDGQN